MWTSPKSRRLAPLPLHLRSPPVTHHHTLLSVLSLFGLNDTLPPHVLHVLSLFFFPSVAQQYANTTSFTAEVKVLRGAQEQHALHSAEIYWGLVVPASYIFPTCEINKIILRLLLRNCINVLVFIYPAAAWSTSCNLPFIAFVSYSWKLVT